MKLLPPAVRRLGAALLCTALLAAGAAAAPAPERPAAAENPIIDTLGPPAAAPPAGAGRFGAFFRLGLAHIWTGYDHLLFLLGLLIVCRRFAAIAAIITCFTLAHSLTLALATLGLVEVSSRLTEPAIAATIVFVGVENLLRRGAEPHGRWAVTFAFGLLHGFGFASVLRDLGLGTPGRSLALPLFAFNLGVETGQIGIAALVLPVIWRLRRNAAFVRRGIPLLSGAIALAGLYWFVERILFDL
mgnify:CR=1 FL=1